jgi:23S rRNA pseudouridine2605 synthase
MIRLQKLLAEAGLGSRRTLEEWIRAGRITVAGRVAKLGDRADATDEIRLDGTKLDLEGARSAPPELLLYYKPLGEVTTRRDPQGRPTVFERLPPPRYGRWISVGRLDVNTAGLLLLTTDGALAHRLMHPSGELEREYLVRVRGRPGAEVIERLLGGVRLEDGPARFDRITSVARADRRPSADRRGAQRPGLVEPGHFGHSTFRVVLHEGRNREVRRLWEAVGFEVSRLLRTRYGPIELPQDLRPGSLRHAPARLVAQLAAQARGERPPAARAVAHRDCPPGRPER